MRILHLEASPGWGGQEMRILREAEGMRLKGHEVVFGVMKRGGLVAQARKAGFIVYEIHFQRLRWLISLPYLLWIIAFHKIDLVNTHSSLDAWIGGLAARIMRKPIVRTRHLSTAIKAGLNSKVLYGMLADFVVTTCSSIIPMIAQQSGKDRVHLCSVPTGVDPTRIVVRSEEANQFRKEIGVGIDDFLVGTACFMRSWKGIGDFLKAADLLRGYERLRWVIIGGGHAETYRKMASELGLDSMIRFTGHLENPFPAIGALDVFALLSTAHEGVSQAILQAAYLAKPLIATPVGGLSEVCLEGETGIQVSPFSPDQVARAVLKIKDDRELKNRLGLRAKQVVEEHFTMAQTLSEMERIYDIVLKRSQPKI